ncbi:MAG: DUF6531 domain-containing protein, partial [Candidatus Riflebacteria bacterium]
MVCKNSGMVVSNTGFDAKVVSHPLHGCPAGATILGAKKFGRGKIVASANETFFSDLYRESMNNPFVPPNDNSSLYLNILAWLAASSDFMISVTPFPDKVWFNKNGVSTGIVFKATTSEPANVTFKVRKSDGFSIAVGSKATEKVNDENIARLSWWGTPGMPDGEYEVIAEANDNSASATFECREMAVNLTGLGKWMKDKKDPHAILPPFAKAAYCPDKEWEQILAEINGHLESVSVGDPVNTSSGNFALPEVDFTLKGRRSFAVARIYNSLDAKIGAFGRGWSSPLLVNLAISNDHIVFTNSDGAKLLFNKSNNTFTPASRTDLTLEFNPDTEFYFLSHPTG